MPRKNNKSLSARTKKGASALTSIIRQSTDVVAKFAANRYTGTKAPMNIARDLSMVRAMFNTEEKHVDTITSVSTLNATTPAVYTVNGPAQGTTNAQREGNSIKVIRFDCLFSFTFGTGTTNLVSAQQFNWYLVRYEKTPSSGGSGTFSIADFLNVDINSNYTPMSLPNSDLNEDFTVLSNGTILVEVPIASATNNVVSRYVPIRHECSFHQEYTGSAFTTIVDKCVFIVLTALQATNTGGTSSCVFSVRQWYIDN